ncbi:efflux RND transporter periplasmic adaptor subunit [Actinophytocola oryzae]|uniref:RND family efflux transporter MFP subunit n=1 Tax=Actinophytocola oryzae TaxID=502181 RepID=A0A4R7UXF3_9PSEU|nr:HlyD family efflux transporter periplasmic adaptor subunit [Actinophytocola oryzae]TDV41499.1 RND family efflux transporter MFP subunit [Actinophytocola oryzae]
MRKLVWGAVGAAVLVGAGVAVVSVATADSGGHYRVAVATVGDVSQTVSVSGTVDRVNRADISFGTAGVLSTLSAGVGDTVSAGQELGAVDTSALQAAVDKASSDVDRAESTLSAAESAVEEPADDSSPVGSLVGQVKDAQSAASAALKAASDAVAGQSAACADPAAPACTAAGAAAMTAQQTVKSAQEALQAKLDALSSALAAESSREQAAPSAGSVADAQASVDQAKVKLVEAQQALAGARLVSPISGTVASVSAAVGDRVAANTAVVVVVGEGAVDLSATVAVEKLADLAVGQSASVTPVGTSERIAGKVTRVGTVPDPAADTVAYPVTVTIDEPPASLAAGSSATASVVVATAKDVLTVPASAVNRGSVTVLTGDQTTVTRVTTGAVGPTRVEVKEGLKAGDQVVLANLDAPLPTSDGNSRGSGGFIGGGPESGPAGGGPGGNVRIRPGG